MSMETVVWSVFGWSGMVVFFVEPRFLLGLCVDLLHTDTLSVFGLLPHTPVLCVPFHH